MSGTLYLLPSPIADGTLQRALPTEVIAIGRRIEHFLVEDAKSARAFLKELGHPKPLRDLSIVEIGHQPRDADIERWLAPLAEGADVAVVSEAGCPAVADPGATLIAAAHRNGCSVVPLVGPSSIMLALMASGLNGQRFRFVGYLPIAAEERSASIEALERDARHGETQIFIETPYRNVALFDALMAQCAASTRLSIAIDLTHNDALVKTRAIAEWRTADAKTRHALAKRPAVFSLLA